MIPVKQLIYKKTICIIGLLFMWQLVVKAQTAVIPQPITLMPVKQSTFIGSISLI